MLLQDGWWVTWMISSHHGRGSVTGASWACSISHLARIDSLQLDIQEAFQNTFEIEDAYLTFAGLFKERARKLCFMSWSYSNIDFFVLVSWLDSLRLPITYWSLDKTHHILTGLAAQTFQKTDTDFHHTLVQLNVSKGTSSDSVSSWVKDHRVDLYIERLLDHQLQQQGNLIRWWLPWS